MAHVIRFYGCAMQAVAKLSHSKGAVSTVSFSENGFYLATAAADGVKLWDLRKLVNFKDIPGQGGAPSFATFDHSGLYLAVGGSSLDVYGSKQDWAVVKSFPDIPKKVSCLPCTCHLNAKPLLPNLLERIFGFFRVSEDNAAQSIWGSLLC